MSAATALLELRFPMSDGAHDRDDGPTPAADESSATSSFDLVIRANRGDKPALDALLARYLPRLQRWAHGRLPPAARGALQTQDLVQDTIMNVVQRLPSFNPRHEGAFQGYVRTALFNRVRDVARQYQRRGPSVPIDSEIADKECSPLELAVGQQTLERYEAALDRLRPDDKALIVARIELGLPYAEIAAMFEKPSVPAAQVALSRALVKLAEEMAYGRKR
jgi:RNA polymerase sigma factor (sigma-70 family)